ncbi:SprT family zinc-dependent metalloprotease [Terasakiella sp. SH-1]|uniref:M48 family metallopeptidase n=1 Tax=Terasakiella sp. SH-1 TaxID=2560057 RepID=UPI001981FCB0|nr:SprT family zinc-dependent metalloprotease [Terasakiella sp. SH-1]
MNIEARNIDVSGIPVAVVRKDIKNLHLSVYPPDGRVRIAVPTYIDDEAIRMAVISKLAWIRNQQKSFRDQPRQTPRECITGESHYFFGQRYLLNVEVTDAKPYLQLRGKKKIDLFINEGMGTEKREALFIAWHRSELKKVIPDLISKWEKKIGVTVNDWGVKRMRTKWGSCNIAAGRIWLNLELAKKPIQCVEYIIVHEMVHLLERHHNHRFIELMDQFMPTWRTNRDLLNSMPLAHEDWKY